jgi:hypothetical protein
MLTAFPRHQWLRERASMLRYTHMAYLTYVLKRRPEGRTFPDRMSASIPTMQSALHFFKNVSLISCYRPTITEH